MHEEYLLNRKGRANALPFLYRFIKSALLISRVLFQIDSTLSVFNI